MCEINKGINVHHIVIAPVIVLTFKVSENSNYKLNFVIPLFDVYFSLKNDPAGRLLENDLPLSFIQNNCVCY